MSSVFGRKPVVPPLATTSLNAGQTAAIAANQAAEPGVAQIAGFTQDQILQMMRTVIPNFDSITKTASSNIGSLLQGKIPSDVTGEVEDTAAGQELGTGIGGSGLGRDLVARDLGLTSLALTEKGLLEAESWMGAAERMNAPAIQDLSSMFVTPMQEYTTTNEQNVQQFERQWMQNQVSAMPDPVLAGSINSVIALISAIRGGGPSQGINQTPNYGNSVGGLGGGGGGGGGEDFGNWSSYGQDWSFGDTGANSMDITGAGVQGVDIPG